MSAETDTLAEQLERTALASDALEAERLRLVVKARLLEQTVPETRIDRFVVVGPLGAGGMGIVYAAYDPELDRKVAIKLVRTWGGERREQDQERLVREARALAKLSHPNVVAVYEVGLHRESVFIAMEFVRGKTLRAHVAAGRTPWREAVRAYLQAAEGLAAAHEAGLVHRDFKPDNAIIGDDGRVRVVDFGLARGEDPHEGGAIATSARGAETPLTVTGALVGTPAYMAPEQRLGLPVGPKSDQFGFCAALHEALGGAPPKIHADGVTLALAPSLPARLRRAVARGLSQSPDDRFPDMRALAAQLRATTETAQRVRITAVVAATIGVGAGAVVAATLSREDPCPDPSIELAGAWDEPSRAALHGAAAELGDVALASATIVERELDAHAAAWVGARRDACEALYVRKTDSPTLFDTRMRCLDRRLDSMTDLVALLADGDASTWEHAVDAVVGLPATDRCSDAEALTSEVPPPVDDAAAIERLRGETDRVQTLERLGRFVEAESLADSLVRDAERLGHRPTEAEALRALALVYAAQERDAEAAPLYVDAAWRAEAGRADEIAADVLAKAMATAAIRGRFEEAEALELRVRGTLERVGRPLPAVEDQLLRSRFILAAAQNRLDEAEGYARASLEESRRTQGERSLGAARDLNNIGLVLYERGEYDAAGKSFTEALAIKREWLGDQHPDVISTRVNLAGVSERLGQSEAARVALESVIADADRALTPNPFLAMALANLSKLHSDAGRHVQAVPLAERAVEVLEASVGEKDERLLLTLNSLGFAYHGVGRLADERACYERMLAIADALDPEHAQKAYAWNNLSELDRHRGSLASARDLAQKAFELWSRVNGPEHPTTGQIALTLAYAEVELGATRDAETHARHAIRVLERGGSVDAATLAGARYVLARALLRQGTDTGRTAAVAAAEAAVEAYESTGNQAEAAEIRDWLRVARNQ